MIEQGTTNVRQATAGIALDSNASVVSPHVPEHYLCAVMLLLRLLLPVLGVVIVSGCHSPLELSSDREDMLKSWFQRRVTEDEARRHFLSCVEHAMERLREPGSSEGKISDADRREQEAAKDEYQVISSRLEPFLSLFRKGDELWLYRTYSDGTRGGESGLALIRGRHVFRRLTMVIYD